MGIWLPNGPDWVVAFLAATRIGAIAVPLNTFYKPRELGWVMRHADVQMLLTLPRFLGSDYLERLETAAPSLAGQKAGALHVRELPYLRDVIVFGHPDRAWARPVSSLEAAADANPAIDGDFLRAIEACVVPADPLIVIYSSGSAADPKGAVHTHGTLIRHSFNLNSFRDLEADDRIFSPMPFFWVGGLVYTLMAAMHTGAFMLCEEAFEPGATLAPARARARDGRRRLAALLEGDDRAPELPQPRPLGDPRGQPVRDSCPPRCGRRTRSCARTRSA